jgi:hypothetical protein
MATRTVDTLSLDGIAGGFFIQPDSIRFEVAEARPKTRLFAFFDGVSVAAAITPEGGIRGGNVVTDAQGTATGIFNIEAFTYNTGRKILKFQDSPVFTSDTIIGSTVSSAEADFMSTRVQRTLQDTITVVTDVFQTNVVDVQNFVNIDQLNIIENNVIGTLNIPVVAELAVPVVAALGDPLAQSFFTYGVKGGCAITKIDIYFATKDEELPVILELRELTNGYPGPKLIDRLSWVSLEPSQVLLSDDSSLATPFEFFPAVVLEENKEYCFVLKTNCDTYNVWTSVLGELSVETGLKVFEQPFIGSMYKSENNITWVTDPTEDIKFTMYKAEYDTVNPATVIMRANSRPVLLNGTRFRVTAGSTLVRLNCGYKHGLRNNDFLNLFSPTGLFRGIPSASLNGDFAVTVINEYVVTFISPTAATSTGTLATPGLVNAIQVDSGGTNYISPVISFASSTGTGASATAVVTAGVITQINITNSGTGYLSAPTISVTDSTGIGALLFVISEALFTISTNRITNDYRVISSFAESPNTSITTNISTTSSEYSILDDVNYTQGTFYSPKIPSILVSATNANTYLSNQTPLSVNVNLSTSNKNTSPIFALTERPRLATSAFIINNQTPIETLTATEGYGTVTGLVSGKLNITNPGAGYLTATVTISAPDVSFGIQATATATITAGSITDITIDNPGIGYVTLPTVTITGTGTITVIAASSANLTPFNTEVLPGHGTAESRYFTQQINLETVSTGVQIICAAYSELESNFDFYIRTSLSSEETSHAGLNWMMLKCDVERNLSTFDGEYLDYTFFANNIKPFDVYDLKIVMRSTNRVKVPRIKNYRTIILAT